MIPNLLNTLIGIVLVYAAVLNPTLIAGHLHPLLVAGVVILVLAGWAMRSDHHPWQNTVSMLMAVLLGVLGVVPLTLYPIVTFWGVFWAGIIVAVMALWAALYRPQSGQAAG